VKERHEEGELHKHEEEGEDPRPGMAADARELLHHGRVLVGAHLGVRRGVDDIRGEAGDVRQRGQEGEDQAKDGVVPDDLFGVLGGGLPPQELVGLGHHPQGGPDVLHIPVHTITNFLIFHKYEN